MTANPDCTYHVVGTQRDDHPQYSLVTGTRAFTGAVTAPALTANFTGTAGRYVGATNGTPSGGPYVAGDLASDPTNSKVWLCTVGGSPGTWKSVVLT